MIKIELTEKQVGNLRHLLETYTLPKGMQMVEAQQNVIAVEQIAAAIEKGIVQAQVEQMKKEAPVPQQGRGAEKKLEFDKQPDNMAADVIKEIHAEDTEAAPKPKKKAAPKKKPAPRKRNAAKKKVDK